MSRFPGVRPVIGSGKADPSKESRDHDVWEESGLLTVTGGKLTTFRRIALDALNVARKFRPQMAEPNADVPVLNPVNVPRGRTGLSEAERRRLLGRYGKDVTAGSRRGLERVPGASTLWAELRWGARAEGVVHPEDLMLRRTRLGLPLSQGGADIMDRIGDICREELGWDEERWCAELDACCRIWRERYALPDHLAVPDWSVILDCVRGTRSAGAALRKRRRRRRGVRSGIASGAVAGAGLLVGLGRWAWRRIK